MWQRNFLLAIAAVGVTLGALPIAAQEIPARLADVTGAVVDVTALAKDKRVFFVTLKATWCPVCQVQLQRLNEKLGRLRSCDATFVVLSPGPRDDLLKIAERNAFPYPFVEDVDLAIARAAGLQLAADQIEPAIFEVDGSGAIVWIARGRSARQFNDEALLARLQCAMQTARR